MHRRVLIAAAVTGLLLAGCQPHATHRSMPSSAPTYVPPAVPDLSGYPAVSADDYVVTGPSSKQVSFRTPDGLTCDLGWGIACQGALRGTPAPANEVELHGIPDPAAVEVEPDGFHKTSNPSLSASAKPLPVGHKIGYQDVQCAVDIGSVTKCTRGLPPVTWFALSPTHSAIGPRTAGLPPSFPDPLDFVVDEQSYSVGSGARNMFPLFTVAAGLTCKIVVFSGGDFGCNGPLPHAAHGENEIYVDLSARQVGTRKTDSPRFTKPMYPGTIRQLPAHYRIDYTYETYTTCLATDDGGVACYGQTPGRYQGFVVSSDSAWTFGG